MDSESNISYLRMQLEFEARIARLEQRVDMEREWRMALEQRRTPPGQRIWAALAIFAAALLLTLLFLTNETKRGRMDQTSHATYFNALIDARLAERLPQARLPTALAPADKRKLATLILFQTWLENQPSAPPATARSAKGGLASFPPGSGGTMASLIDSFVKGLTDTGMVLAGEVDEVKSALIDALREIGVNTASDATGAIRDVTVHGTKGLIDKLLEKDATAAHAVGGYRTTDSFGGSAFAAAGGFPGQIHIYCSPRTSPRTGPSPRTQPIVRNHTPAVCEPPKHQESKQETDEGSDKP